MTAHPLHEVSLSCADVRALLAEQHPDLAGLPIQRAGHGWDNLTFRLGTDLAVRLPARAAAVPLVASEQRWLARLAGQLPVAVPVPVRTGLPSARFSWPWTVVRWVPGTPAAATPVAARTAWAGELARALVALHTPAPDDAPANPYRGVPLAARDAVVTARFDPGTRHDVLRRAWTAGLAARPWDGPPLWLHGDPHPSNLVVRDGRLAGLVDFGDLTAGDPANDLATAWTTFDPDGRTEFIAHTRELREVHASTWLRARAWAAAMVPVLTAHTDDDPVMAAVGEHTLAQLTQELGTPHQTMP